MTSEHTPTHTVEGDAERQSPTKAQRDTFTVLEAGILPHSTHERDHARALLGAAYTIQGGKRYVERVANYNSKNVILGLPPEITLGAQLGYESSERKELRTRLASEQRDGVMMTIADHMMDYVEDANLTVEALYDLDESIGSSHPGQGSLGALLVDPRPEIHHAVATLARLYETKQYASSSLKQMGHMDTDLLGRTEEVDERIADALRDITIGETRKDITEALRLEIGRMDFWTDQLFGHPSRSSRRVPLGETGDFDEPAVQKRYGVIAINNPLLRDKVLRRMSLIELGGMVTTQEDDIKK
jgi:hypothetical protein